MISEWIAIEHYRLHLVENWPHSAHREATLAAIYSTLSGLDRNWRSTARHTCMVCLNESGNVQVFPDSARVGPKKDDTPHIRSARVRTAGSGA
ncbi:MAG TPA: hypothetical protein VKR43_07525 [Bryobacteraceae bacterium]|nr:hypothetical protein [Bryobacteraceae bacterium]